MKCKAVFVSDIHLGTKDSMAKAFLGFIKEYEFEEIYLVGDIIDGWSLKRKWFWPQLHSDVIQKLLRLGRKGVKITYVLGNHDEFIRPFLPIILGDNIHIVNEYSYKSIKKQKFWIIHGDFFDSITINKKWLAILGDRGYQFLLRLNIPINYVRKKFGKKYFSLSAYVKEHIKKSLMYIYDYENILSKVANEKKYNGVICGHIHKTEDKMLNNIRYLNCGDWVESCSAIVETYDGEFKIIYFNKD